MDIDEIIRDMFEPMFSIASPSKNPPLTLRLRLTSRAQDTLRLASQEAQRFNHTYIGTEHLLCGLTRLKEGVAITALKNLGIDLRKVRYEVEKIVHIDEQYTTITSRLPYTPRAKRVLISAQDEAMMLRHYYIGTEHILLGLLQETDSVACYALARSGVTMDAVRKQILSVLRVT